MTENDERNKILERRFKNDASVGLGMREMLDYIGVKSGEEDEGK